MKIKNKLFFAGLVVLSGCLFTFLKNTSAQNDPTPNVTTVATVNIYNAKIDSQVGNKFVISFDIYNRTGYQPGVKYSIDLIRVEGGISKIYDQKNYTETINLSEGETIHKVIEYDAPSFAKGDFELWITGKNDRGLDLALGKAGKFKLAGSGDFVEIESCYLNVEGEKNNTKYSVDQGVDISSEENLLAVCELKNSSKNQVTVIPSYKTYFRSTSGQLLNSINDSPITVSAGENKQVQFAIPSEEKPQAYDIAMVLTDSQGKNISNSINFHYVIRGMSGTIQNLRLDKNSYAQGDIAKISFFWSGPSDVFRDSRGEGTKINGAMLELSVADSSGRECAGPIQKRLTEENTLSNEVDLLIKSDCSNPQLSASLKDLGGNILDKTTFGSNVFEKMPTVNRPEIKKDGNEYVNIILILTVILILVIFLAYSIKKRSKNTTVVSLFFAIFLSGFLLSQKAQADTFAVADAFGIWYWNANLDKPSYSPGEQIYAYSTGAVAYNCLNRHYMEIWGTVNGIKKMIYGGITNEAYFTNAVQGNAFVAQSIGGSYLADFEYRMSWYPVVPHGYIPYDVICTSSNWIPDPSTIDCGIPFTQNGDCPGVTRPATGTKNCCYCNSTENLTYCGIYTNSCGTICNGTKDCSNTEWKEVSP